MTDISQVAKELMKAAEALTAAADALLETSDEHENTEPARLTLPDVRSVLADLARKGHSDEVRALIEKYGADRLSKVDSKNYEALLKDAKEIEDAK